MKITQSTLKFRFCIGALILCAFCQLASAAEPTAFDLMKKADPYVGEDARGKVVQIRSEKSIASLTPEIWYVVFYDPDATFKATEVRFAAGEKTDVKRPFRILEMVKADKIFDKSKLNTDSDAAIKIATSQPLLDNLTIKATQLWLDTNLKTDLSVTGPIWRVRLWAAKLAHPNRDVDIGDVFISCADGKVVKTDLHIDRVD